MRWSSFAGPQSYSCYPGFLSATLLKAEEPRGCQTNKLTVCNTCSLQCCNMIQAANRQLHVCSQESPQAVVHSLAAVAALQGLPATAKLTLCPPPAKQPPPLMQTVAPSAVLLSSHPGSSLIGKKKTHGRRHHQRQRSLTVMTQTSGGQGSSSRSRADHLTRISLTQPLRTQQLI